MRSCISSPFPRGWFGFLTPWSLTSAASPLFQAEGTVLGCGGPGLLKEVSGGRGVDRLPDLEGQPRKLSRNLDELTSDLEDSFHLSAYLRMATRCAMRDLGPWDSPGRNTGVGCHFLLQGIFLTQGSNLGLLHWEASSSSLRHLGSPCLTAEAHAGIWGTAGAPVPVLRHHHPPGGGRQVTTGRESAGRGPSQPLPHISPTAGVCKSCVQVALFKIEFNLKCPLPRLKHTVPWRLCVHSAA